MPEGLAVYSLPNAKAALEARAQRASIPWALVKPQFLAFVEYLRDQGVFICEALDHGTAEAAQEVLFVEGKNIQLSIQDGLVVIHRAAAQSLLNQQGAKKFGMQWGFVKATAENFLNDLYGHNVFLASAQPQAATWVREKTSEQNIYLRLKSLEPMDKKE